jgi:hypothetical protein
MILCIMDLIHSSFRTTPEYITLYYLCGADFYQSVQTAEQTATSRCHSRQNKITCRTVDDVCYSKSRPIVVDAGREYRETRERKRARGDQATCGLWTLIYPSYASATLKVSARRLLSFSHSSKVCTEPNEASQWRRADLSQPGPCLNRRSRPGFDGEVTLGQHFLLSVAHLWKACSGSTIDERSDRSWSMHLDGV